MRTNEHNNADDSRIAPNLRFPEFSNSAGWRVTALGSLCDMKAGNFIPASEISDKQSQEMYPCYGGNGLRGYTKSFTHTGRFSLIGRQGALCGNVKFVSGDFHATEHAIVTTPNTETDNGWLYYLLCAMKLNRFATGQAQPGLSVSTLESLLVPVPEKTEQERIAACLSSIDALIASENQKFLGFKEQKRGLMQQVFPDKNGSDPKLRTSKFGDTKNWKFSELGSNTVKIGSGVTPRGGQSNYRDSGRLFLRSQNIGWGSLILDDAVYIDEGIHENMLATEVKEDDVLLNITGASIGRSAVADQRAAGGNVNQHVCIIRTLPDQIDPVFLNQFILSKSGQDQIDAFQAGGNRQGLNFQQIKSFLIPTPPEIEEQRYVANTLQSMDKLVSRQFEKVEQLMRHKSGLLQGLFPALDGVQE